MPSLNWNRRPASPPDPADLAPVHSSALLDLNARVNAALAEIDGLMKAELAKGRDGRDTRFFNSLLDVRNALAPGTTVLPLRPSGVARLGGPS